MKFIKKILKKLYKIARRSEWIMWLKEKIQKLLGIKPTVKRSKKMQPLVDMPYGPKISSITDAGIEFYWKKVENADGYEVFRSYNKKEGYEKIAVLESRGKGTYVDADFDHSKKKVYYKARSFLKDAKGGKVYSPRTKAATASFRSELQLDRDTTYMYDGATRKLCVYYGWGEVKDGQWTSSNEAVAQIHPDGTIHALATGETVLTCTSASVGMSATAKVVVNREAMQPLDTGARRYAFDAESGYWKNPAAEKTNDAVIMMVGDMMCGSTQTKMQFTAENGWSYNDSYAYVKDTTAQADFALGNLETLMAAGWPYMIDEVYIENTNNCNSPSRYLDAVLSGGFDAVTMANNHNCDGGTRALKETIDQVVLRNIPYTGIFKDEKDTRFMLVDINGIKVAFLAYMSRFTSFNGKDATWSKEEKDLLLNVFSKNRAIQDISNCKAAGAEYVIAYMHWGKKNFRAITERQKQEAQEVADAGADYIVGANPHVLQIYDEIRACDGRSVPCFYSTGNFQAYMDQIPGNRDSVMVRIRLQKDADGKVVLAENGYIPYHTYTLINGKNWAPVAVNTTHNQQVTVPDRRAYCKRIVDAIGEKVMCIGKPAAGADVVEVMEEKCEKQDLAVNRYTIRQACQIIGVELPEKYDDIADNVLTNIAPVVNSLAYRGALLLSGKDDDERADQLSRALKKKIQFVFAGRSSRNLEMLQRVPHVFVKDPYDAMVKLSRHIREEMNLKVVGVTGSLGKTTTKEMVHAVLSQYYVTDKNYGNRNNTKGIFMSLQSLEANVQCYVQEFGVAIGKKSMESKVAACCPNAAIITNINDPHLDHFGTRKNILREKIKLVTEMEEGCPAFLNYDDPLLREVTLEKHPIISFAIENADADYHAENIRFEEECIHFDAIHGDRRTAITIHSRGRHNIGNALVSMAVGEWFGVPLEKIVEGLADFRSEGIRQSLVNVGGYKLYVDCYNTAPISLLGAIDVLERIDVEQGGKRIAVLGDIVRLGTEEKRLHKEVGEKIGRSKVDLVLCFGNDNAKLMAETINAEGTKALYTEDRAVLDAWMREMITKKDVTLIKGPVARLLSKSIDQVFGTSYHVRSEHHERTWQGNHHVDIIFEKEDHSRRTAALLEYNGADAEHTVPAKCVDVDISIIYNKCFENNQNLTSVTIPEPIYNISERAFADCCKLEKVSLPSTMMVIGESAFANCVALTEMVLPEKVIDIGEKAFENCEKLTRVEIPASVGHIGENAFAGCPNVHILCDKDSVAHAYAVDNGLACTVKEA